MPTDLEKGLEVFEEMLPPEISANVRQSLDDKSFGAERARLSLEFVFGKLWSRPDLDRRSRSLVTLGILVAQGQTEELKVHVLNAVRNGLSVREIEEVLYHSVAYVGFPACNKATRAAAEALKQAGLIE